MKRLIKRFIRNSSAVEGGAQEALLRVYAVEQSRLIEQPKSFLSRIAKCLARSQLTRKSQQIAGYIQDLTDSSSNPLEHSVEEETTARERLGWHCNAVAKLAPECRQVYLLRKMSGFSHKEIAEHLSLPLSTVEKHLMKALEQCDRQ